jgi:hypothetical protein
MYKLQKQTLKNPGIAGEAIWTAGTVAARLLHAPPQEKRKG